MIGTYLMKTFGHRWVLGLPRYPEMASRTPLMQVIDPDILGLAHNTFFCIKLGNNIRKNILAYLFSFHNIISVSIHEQLC